MSNTMKAYFSGPDWAEIAIPEWFKERAEKLIAELGDDNPEVQLFKNILAAGHLEQSAVIEADQIASTSKNGDVFVLAIDIASHGVTVMQAIGQIAPIAMKTAA